MKKWSVFKNIYCQKKLHGHLYIGNFYCTDMYISTKKNCTDNVRAKLYFPVINTDSVLIIPTLIQIYKPHKKSCSTYGRFSINKCRVEYWLGNFEPLDAKRFTVSCWKFIFLLWSHSSLFFTETRSYVIQGNFQLSLCHSRPL